MTVVDQVKEDSLAGRKYPQLLEPLAADHERIVSHVNGVDVLAVGFDETLSRIKGPMTSCGVHGDSKATASRQQYG